MATLSFSETYNLFRINEVSVLIKECLLGIGILDVRTTSNEGEAILDASRLDLSMRITLSEQTIGKEGSIYLRGQPKVRIEVSAKSQDGKDLAKVIEQFKNCLFVRTARGGG